jgi:hypothetical protein
MMALKTRAAIVVYLFSGMYLQHMASHRQVGHVLFQLEGGGSEVDQQPRSAEQPGDGPADAAPPPVAGPQANCGLARSRRSGYWGQPALRLSRWLASAGR